MNSRIKLLPDDLITRIAAGEVVERPASVLKELIENSLDSGADQISVTIEGAGRTLLSVSDNGCGMTKVEIPLALRRHATSKISQLEDLETIDTYGFRGEALPSICSVSRLRLVSRSQETDTGWEWRLEGGKRLTEKPIAREAGTTIEVRDLFFNTPARYKFLKADATERSQCLRVIEEMAYASSGVTFRVKMESAKPLVFQGRNAEDVDAQIEVLKTRVPEAWGSRFSGQLVGVNSQSPHFQLSGVVSHPHFHQATTRYQFLYINRRPIQNRRFARAIYDAYIGRLPTMRHPSWVLFLTLDPRTVDVNVHPTKREVKLTHEQQLFGFILSSIRNTFTDVSTGAETSVPEFGRVLEKTFSLPPAGTFPTRGSQGGGTSFSPSSWKETPSLSNPAVSSALQDLYSPAVKRSLAEEPVGGKAIRAIAQVKNMYILAQSEDGVMIVDQHAAAERVYYEKFLNNFRSKKPQVQMLLVPFSWEVSMSLYPSIEGKLEHFQTMGFLLEPFGDNTFLVKGVPSVFGKTTDMSSLLDGISDVFGENAHNRQGQHVDFQHRLAAMSACKAAVKAGDALTIEECQSLLDQNLACDAPLTCPHGRPAYIQLAYPELERRFQRT